MSKGFSRRILLGGLLASVAGRGLANAPLTSVRPAPRAGALDLGDPGRSWHSTRDGLGELAGWITLVTGSLGKMGEDLLAMTQSGIDEVKLGASGGSSTMPQKNNPVLPSLLVAIAHHAVGLNATMQAALIHRQQRDGAAWMMEWMALPQLVMVTARALSAALELAENVTPDAARMAALLDDGSGLIHAEALSFALARQMPRPEAQEAVKALCQKVRSTGTPLPRLVAETWPQVDLDQFLRPENALGQAPAEARDFANAAENI